jgi:molybdopterin molybdotransferase
MTKKLKNTCVNEFDPDALEEEKAIKFILNSIVAKKDKERLPIRNTLGRVVGDNIKSKLNIPNFNNSAMDGYAINIQLLKKNNYILQEKGVSLAGKPYSKKLTSNIAIKVMTGAVIPNNCDAVVMKEMVDIKNDHLYFPKRLEKNQNIRKIGEDIRKNDIVIKKGEIINHSHLGILSSLGIKEINVMAKPIISFFSTGDELVSMDTKLSKGMIYDSNRYILYGLLKKLPVIIKDRGVVRDQEKILIKKLAYCSQKSDIIITTGGVSVGDADYIKNALNKLGNINFWKIAIKPGRPLAYGKINKSYFFGLPGNPVSAVVTFQLFVNLAIEKLIGIKENKYIKLEATTTNDLSKKKGRVEYKRGYFSQVNNENLVSVSGQQGSNILTSLSNANCYIRLDSNVSKVKKGDKVTVIPFNLKI